MAYIIQTPRATFRSMREAEDTTQLNRKQIIRLCQTANSGWTMSAVGGSRSDADRYHKKAIQREWLATAEVPPEAVEPTPVAVESAPVVKPLVDPLVDLVAELRELRGEVARLRSEVVELTAQTLDVLTLPAGTQLNLPLHH